ncbi:MAG: hypothetical protein GY953_45210, partial [bacterium]|nr:hypothetical protein [bacterium]
MIRRHWILLLLAGILAGLLAAQAQQQRRPQRPRRPRAVGPLVRIPSKVAGTEGLVLRVVRPKQPRYKEGAPVVVHVPGGFSRGAVDFSQGRLDGFGFVEVLLTFPGGRSDP